MKNGQKQKKKHANYFLQERLALNLVIIIKYSIDEHKAKKRRKAESVDTQTSDN